MTLVQERMEEGSEVLKIVAAEVEDYITGTFTYLPSLLFMILLLFSDLVRETLLTTTLVAEGGDQWCPG